MGPTDGWINKCGDRLGRNRVPVGDLELAIAADSFGLNHDLILGSERGALTGLSIKTWRIELMIDVGLVLKC